MQNGESLPARFENGRHSGELRSHVAFDEAAGQKRPYQNLMLICCILFGLAMIANAQAAGEGTWFWYATFLRDGKRLYSDMHLALQPLFVLETASFLAVFGKGWLVSKIPAILHLVAYCFGLSLLAKRSELPDWQKAVILGCAFFISIAFIAYRFDDYHVLADCFLLYSIVLLLQLQESRETTRSLSLIAGLGILSGLSFTTRLNDGGVLALGVTVAIFCLAPSRRLISIAIFGAISALTVLLVVRLSGDSFHDYAMYSIFKAAGSKGGASNVLLYPLELPWNAITSLKTHWYAALDIYAFGASAICVVLLRLSFVTRRFHRLTQIVLVMLIVLLPLRIHHLYRGFFDSDLTIALSAIAVPVAYLLGGFVVARCFIGHLIPGAPWNRREVLLLIPLGQLVAGSMSSGGKHIGLYQPLAVLMLLLPFASPLPVRIRPVRSFLLVLIALIGSSCVVAKVRVPFFWHSYREKPMFLGREWYRHPVYGPMIIDKDLLVVFTEICSHTGTGPHVELLSLPYPYANYFCDVPPWHEYVQTFFDTSSKETIFDLMQQLQQAPPEWVLYQRQLDNLVLHETTYNHGKPLPHRYLDQMIEQKTQDGEWKVVSTSNYEETSGWRNEWILIRTRP
jgi:hypothetical protein